MAEHHEHDTCLQCGYSLQTLTNEQSCPECGKSVGQSRDERSNKERLRVLRRDALNLWVNRVLKFFLLLVLFAVVAHEVSTCKITIYEFSSGNFETRQRTWYVFPFLRFRLTQERIVNDGPTKLSQQLFAGGHLSSGSQPLTWLVYREEPRPTLRSGNPLGNNAMMVNKFQDWDGELADWSRRQPSKAPIFWPIVLDQLARGGSIASWRINKMIEVSLGIVSPVTDDAYRSDLENIAKLQP